MDLAQVFIFELGWVFFAAWGLVLAALSMVAFGQDILPAAHRAGVEKDRS